MINRIREWCRDRWAGLRGHLTERELDAIYRRADSMAWLADERCRADVEEQAAQLTKQTGRPWYAHRHMTGVWQAREVVRDGIGRRQAEAFERWAQDQADGGGPVSHG